MGDVSKHFSRSEFACKCGCGLAAVDVQLLAIVEAVREHFGAAVVITSGCRCKSHNKSIGGSLGSMHMKCMAADIIVIGVAPADVQAFLIDLLDGEHGLGCYDGFTHVDSRGNPARW